MNASEINLAELEKAARLGANEGMKTQFKWKVFLPVTVLLGGFGCLLFFTGSLKVDDGLISNMLNNNGFSDIELTGYRSLYECPVWERKNYARAFKAVSHQGLPVTGYVCHTLSGYGTIQLDGPSGQTIKVSPR